MKAESKSCRQKQPKLAKKKGYDLLVHLIQFLKVILKNAKSRLFKEILCHDKKYSISANFYFCDKSFEVGKLFRDDTSQKFFFEKKTKMTKKYDSKVKMVCIPR